MEEGLTTPKHGGKLRKLINNNGFRHKQQQQEEYRLSSLFDPLLVEILSLLPIESAAATSVLSRRWRYLWTQITSLRFTSDNPLSAVNHILPQLTSPLIRVLIIDEGNSNSFITSCFDHIRSQNDVEEIEVSSVDDSVIILPAWVFQCRSLVSLELFGQWNFELVNSLYLPNLKKLSLEINYSAARHLLGTLFKSCPLLEVVWVQFLLSLENEEYLVDICAPNLKSLRIELTDCGPLRLRFVINAPKLVDLWLGDYYSSSRYTFVSIPPMLVKAHLYLSPDGEEEGLISSPDTLVANLVQAISSVRSLKLRNCSKMVKYFGCINHETLPIFRNLTFLQLDFDHEPGCWKDLLLSLRCFPKLESLKVSRCPPQEEDWSGLESLPSRFLSKLKILEIERLPLYDSDTRLIGYILRNAHSLEKLIVNVSVKAKEKKVRVWKEYEFCETLFKLPKSSCTCEIELFGDHIHASSNAFSGEFLACLLRYGEPKN